MEETTSQFASISVSKGMERAMGIEPTFEAWEAPVLPLNYARMTPKDRGHTCAPRGIACPHGVEKSFNLSNDRPPCGSLLPFGPGPSFHPQYLPHYRTAFAFFRNPLPAVVSQALTG